MSTVYWTPSLTSSGDNPMEVARMLFSEPTPLAKLVVAAHPNAVFTQCPAFIDFCRNVFVVSAPLDVTITYDSRTGHVMTDTFPQPFFNEFCVVRSDGTMSFPPAYVFFSHDSVLLEVFPAPMLSNMATENTMVVPGMFDIGKWVRPVEFAFSVRDKNKPVVIKKGDPLFAVRFTPADGSKVEFERVEYTPELRNLMSMGLSYKLFVKNTTLKTLYKLAEAPVKLFLSKFKKPSKCPFGAKL